MAKLKKLLYENKEGILIGGIIAYLVWRFMLPATFDFQAVVQSQGVIDMFKTAGTTTIEFAKTKVMWGMILIGAFLGFVIDYSMKERWWKKWF